MRYSSLVKTGLWCSLIVGILIVFANALGADVPQVASPVVESINSGHPRLYLDPARLKQLRRDIRTTHLALWRQVLEQAYQAAKRSPPEYRKEGDASGEEQLWQRDVGDKLPLLAMAWLMSGQRSYLEAARTWALASCNYPTWGLGTRDGTDLAAGHQLFGLAILYDWCYHDLDPESRKIIRETLIRRSRRMYVNALNQAVSSRGVFLQGHVWVKMTGLGAVGLALEDELGAEATKWVHLSRESFEHTMHSLGPDGASHAGVDYWEYGVEHILKFTDLATTRLGLDLRQSDWWRHTASYSLYLDLPRHAWSRTNCIVDLADCLREHRYGPDYVLRRLAREFRDSHAQWLAQELDDGNVAARNSSWLNLLWFDATVPLVSPTDLPTLHHFSDMDIVSDRSDWSGDESLLVFKCGPFIGHRAMHEFSSDPGGGHAHPDANHFVLFGAGEWLIRDDGYVAKWTGQHNTLLVDNQGQLGEGSVWFRGNECLVLNSEPRILRATSGKRFDQITGDATPAYRAALGLQRYIRHLLFLKPSVLIVCDEVSTDKPRLLELRFHPEARPVQKPDAFVMRSRKAVLHLKPLTSDGLRVSWEEMPLEDQRGDRRERLFTIRLSQRAQAWRNAVALSWAPFDQHPKQVSAVTDGDIWKFTVDGQIIQLDWRTGLAEAR